MGPRTLQMTMSTHLDCTGHHEVWMFYVALFRFSEGQNDSPLPTRESTAGRYRSPISRVHDDEVRVGTGRNRSAHRRGGGREGEDGTGHQ